MSMVAVEYSPVTLIISISDDLERALRAQSPNLDDTAKEALLVELYRRGQLTHKQFADALGKDRCEAEAVLKNHNVTEDLPTIEEINQQVEYSRSLRTNGKTPC
jgi:molecular chaperone GrpE (heat shock protein)